MSSQLNVPAAEVGEESKEFTHYSSSRFTSMAGTSRTPHVVQLALT